ncbi:MAG: ABC transporter permease subunit [Candidatus Korarchaeota archaeon]|nr:ABC transporter permease subunit [Candidatus Korarchaeota archaeon]NIU85366.1 ABC transporter permease subunit [Candidatus Thorarchaeota archaeon]NIW15464.1 ABC transporter permease subunit [Candidatus Thorarchaeota archaeon]NIW53408.1 ABC transporter permease subunit [Candidatus Korarchaeota archaeon]
MGLTVIFRRETQDTVLSKNFLIYLILLGLPVVMSVWFSWRMYEDPSILARMTFMLPEPIQVVTPMICMMTYLDMTTFSIALVAVLHASDFIAGEQDRGMLTLLVSKPMPRWHIILGKYLSFMLVFLPLLTLNLLLMATSINLIGIGTVEGDVFAGYLFAVLFYGIVYASITTLSSVLSTKPSVASLGTIIFLILWIILDFMTIYLPQNTADFLSNFSLSHHINIVLGFVSNGEAAIFVRGGIAKDPSFETLTYSLSAILLPLTLLPVLTSLLILEKKDVQSR